MSPQNPYDAVLEEVGPVAPQAVDDNPYATVLQEQTTREDAAFRTAQQAARTTTPDRAAEAQRLSDFTGLPVDVVHRNFEDIQKRSGIADTAYTDLQRRSPALAGWLADPQHAAVARDDLPALQQTERGLSFMDAVLRGAAQARGLMYSAEEYVGERLGAPGLQAAGQAGRRSNRAIVEELTAPPTPFRGPWDVAQWVKDRVGEQVPIMGSMIVGAETGGAIGSLAGPVGATVGATIGALLPAAAYGLGTMQQSVKQVDETAQAPWTVFLGGSAIAAFDTVLPGHLGGKLVASFGRVTAEEIAARALTTVVKPRFLRLVAGEAVRDLATEGITEALQDAIEAHATSMGMGTSVDYPALGAQMAQSFAAGALLGLGGGTVAGVAEFRHERHLVAAAQAQADLFTALGGTLKDSKTLERMPEAVQAFIAHATKDGPVETVYVDTQAFTTYWQAKGVDPALVAQELLGNTEAYPEAIRTGEALAIPTAAYAVKIAPTDHNTFFAQELRFAPGEMNAREAKVYGAALEQSIAEATAAAAAAPTQEPTPAQAADPIYATVQTQLVQAGQPLTEAHANATIVAAAYHALGERYGTDPLALFQRRGWIIGAPVDEATLRTREATRAPRAADVSSEETPDAADVSAAPDAGVGLADTAEEQPGPDQGGVVEGRGDGDGAERGGVSPAVAVSPGGPVATPAAAAEPADVFVRQPAADTAARVTPEVHRELVRVLDEMETFPYVGRTWVWLEGPKTGNAAGGAADIIAGHGGAQVYDDILYLAPVNRVTSGARKGEAARRARGSRGEVVTAIRRLLDTGEVATNLGEGVLRVAERRAAGDWRELSKPELPHATGLVAPVALTDALAGAIDDALAAGEGEGDLSFDVGELELQSGAAPGAVDVLETGELQPRLPGAEAVRDTEQATPEFDVPFSLTPEAAPVPGVQPSLVAAAPDEDPETFFQAALGTLRGFTRAVAPWLTDQERGTIIDRQAQRAVAIHRQLPRTIDFVHAAQAGQVKRFWYKQAARSLEVLFGAEDAPRFAALLAALSPQNAVKDDLINSIRVWLAWEDLSPAAQQGMTRDGLRTLMQQALPVTVSGAQQQALPAWIDNALIALTAPDPTTIQLSGPKVNSFYGNLIGHWHEVTNDSWMAAFAGLAGDVFGGTKKTTRRVSGKKAIYYAYNAKVRQAAQMLTARTGELWTPDEVQAAVWAWTWTLANVSEKTKLTPAQVITQGLVTDEEIAQTPDFAALLQTDPMIRGILEQGNYGPELDDLAAEFAAPLDDRRPGAGDVATAGGAKPGRQSRAAARRDERERIASHLRSARRLARNRAGESLTLNQSPVAPAPTFYSRLTRAVEGSTLAKASGAQWNATIANAKTGINRDEFAFARLDDLADGTVYTKADVLAFLAANTLTLEDVTLGDRPGPTPEQVRTRAEELYDAAIQEELQRLEEGDEDYYDEISYGTSFNETEGAWEAAVDGEDLGEWYDTQEEAEAAVDARVREVREGQEDRRHEILAETARDNVDYDEAYEEAREGLERQHGEAADRVQYAEYVEPGAVAGSYREVFLTVPQVRSEATVPTLTGLTAEELYELRLDGWRVPLEQIAQSLADGRTNEAVDHVDSIVAAGPLGRSRLLFLKLQQNLIWQKVAAPLTWEDGHDAYSDIKNPVVRLRFNERVLPAGAPIVRRRLLIPPGEPYRDPRNVATRWRIAIEGEPLHQQSFPSEFTARADLERLPTVTETPTQRVLFLEEVQPPHADQPVPPLLRKHWREIGFKWALRHAAEQGFDAVAWTTGAMQAARYSLEKEVDSIAWTPSVAARQADNGASQYITITLKAHGSPQIRFHVDAAGTVLGGTGASARAQEWAGAPLANVVGKEIAAEITGKHQGELKGEGLKIGGEGLKRLYDVDFKTVVQKIPAVKAAGGKVSTAPLEQPPTRLNSAGEQRRAIGVEQDAAGNWFLRLRDQTRIYAERVPEVFGNVEGPLTNVIAATRALVAWNATIEPTMVPHTLEVPILALTPAIKAAVLGGQPLFQAAAAGPRAAVTFTPATIQIQLFAGADASSFMHEGAHAFFEVFGDLADDLRSRDPATLTPDQQRLLTDYDTALGWLGITDRGQVGVAQHEQFARGFEAYLREGTAPSKALRSVFAQFRHWLLTVYQSLLQLDVVLTPEVRAIFDRLLASDTAIAEAEAEPQVQPLFTTPESAGMTPAAFAQYRDLVQAASDQAKAELSARLYRDWERERTATWHAARERIRAAVTAEVQQEPVYRARAAIRTGTHPDGTPLVPGQPPTPIAVNMNPLLPPAAGEISLDAAAELFGFTSGDDLAHALRTAPTQRRVIAARTYARLRAELGDVPLQRAVLHEKAEEAVYGAGRQVVVQAELKALTAGLQRGVIPPAALLRQHARTRIRATRIRDLRPGTFLVAAQRASQRAFDLKESDRVGAVQAKQQELVNLALYREAVAARDTAEATAAWIRAHDREPARRRLGKAGASYLEQWDGVLERFEFKRVTHKDLDWRAAIAAWAAAQEADNLPVDLPALLLDETKRTNYQNLTVDELADVREGLEQLTHLARLKNRLLTAQRQRDFTVAVDTITTSLRAHHPSTALPLEFLPKDVKARKVSAWFASHRKLANLIRAMDGFEDGGPLWEYLLRPINAAATREAALNQEATIAMGRLLTRAYTGRDLAHLRDTQVIPAIKGSLSKEARLMVALNWGNDGNRQRLRDGRQWTDAQVQAILDTLDARDVRFVQDVWDYIDTYWPAIAAKQRRVTGVAPGKVEASPFVTKHGTSRGGYFPLAYDPRLSARAGSFIDVEQANLQTQAAYTKATTRRGHTEARAARVSEPIRLELSVLYGHVEQVIHDLSHHEMLIDVGRLLGDRRVQQAIYETHGDIVYRQLKNALVDIAYGARPSSNAAEAAINYLRQGTTVAGLAWNVWTAVQQPIGVFNGMARVGPGWVLRGLTHMLRDAASMESTARWVHERSEMMRLRHTTQQREISELRTALAHPGGWFDTALRRVTADTVRQQDIAASYFWLIGQAQQLADLPTWIGQYEKAMAAGEPEARAVALAEQAVLDAQGGGQVKDLAEVQRGSAVFKLFTNFYSYGNLLYNQTMDAYEQTNFRRAGSVGQFAGNLLLLYTFPALASVLLAQAFGRDDDEEGFLHAMGREVIGQALNTMVLLRELGGLARLGGARGYEGPAGTRAIGAAIDVATQAQQGELDRGLLRATEDAAGILFRLPLNQVQRSIDGFVALQEGRTRNPLALLTGPPRK